MKRLAVMLLVVLGLAACTSTMTKEDGAERLSRPTEYRLFQDYGNREADF